MMDTAAARTACGDLFPKIQDILDEHDLPKNAAVTSLFDASGSGADLGRQILDALKFVSKLIIDHSASHPVWLSALLDALANATREQPFWRPLFGHPSSFHADSPPSCILDAVQRVIHVGSLVHDDWPIEQDHTLRPTLRLIANCCADDNISRSVLVNSGGINYLRDLAFRRRALDLLLPTIYNVCVDYDQIAVDIDGNPLKLKDLDTGTELTVTEQALGRTYEHAGSRITAVQLFLDLCTQCDEACLGFVADLVEMASRPALFGAHNILGAAESIWPLQSQELLADLLKKGMHIIDQDEDTTPAILQTFLNVLSQKQFQIALVRSPDDLMTFTKLVRFLPEDEPGLKRYADSLLQVVYALSALPEYAEAFAPSSSAFSSLVQQLELLPEAEKHSSSCQSASIIILLANSLTSPDRIALGLSQSANLPQMIANTIRDISNPITLVPALDLASRLALDPAGRNNLLHSTIFNTLTHLLKPPTSPPAPSTQTHTLTIHRESITLTRLLLKCPPHPIGEPTSSILPPTQTHPTSELQTSFPGLNTTILALFTTTLDDATKLDIGRYTVELLRHLIIIQHTQTPQQRRPTSSTSSSIPTAPLLAPLIHLLTNSPTASGRAEAVFGLGLLLSRASTSASTSTNTSTIATGSETDTATDTDNASTLHLASLVQERKKVLAALEAVADGADSAKAAEPEPGLEGGGMLGDTDDGGVGALDMSGQSEEGAAAAGAGARMRAEKEGENVKMVVVGLLRALGGSGEWDGVVRRDGADGGDGGGEQEREGKVELIQGLEALAGRLGLRV